jgi:hypothetical protein
MSEKLCIPIKKISGDKWGNLGFYGPSQKICAESCSIIKEKFSLSGGHRVRLYRLKSNVHWLIPIGVDLDIVDVPPAAPPRRR